MNYPKMTPPPTKELKTSLLYRSVTCWSSLINTSQEAPKEPENPGPQTSCPLSLLPHILLSQHNPSYQWPPKLLQGLSQRALPNTILLSHFPNLLRNPEEELEDPFLLDLIDLTKLKSEPPSLMLFRGTSNAKENEEEGVHQTMRTLEIEEVTLLMMSPMEQVSRTMSLSSRLGTLNL